MFERNVHRVLVASDASYERETGAGEAGFLVVSDPGQPGEIRLGRVWDIPTEIYALWGNQGTYITQLELMTVVVAMIECASLLRNSRGLFFIDNVGAVMALVKGRSNTESLDQMARLAQMVNFSLGASAYYEYVETKANWADEISRLGLKGTWAKKNGFKLARCQFVPLLLWLPCFALVKVFQFL